MLTQPQQASTAEPELGTAQPQLVIYITQTEQTEFSILRDIFIGIL